MPAPVKFETLCLHAGYTPDSETRSQAVPLYRTTSYTFKDTAHAADLFALKTPGHIYTRIGNPTQDVLEKRVAALEGGAGALALASGTSAIFYSIINICTQGDEIVAANNLYGGTYTMFAAILPQFGIQTRFADPLQPDDFEKAITDRTRCLFIESIGNPTLKVADIAALARIAHAHGLPLIVDNTFATPYLLRPMEHGADIVVHSLTKWMGGHGAAIGGIVVDCGRFNWQDARFTLYNTPDAGYHGLRFAHDLGADNPVAFILRLRLVALRNLGACISPDNAWLFLQGLETLPVRMERHCGNALKVARFLKTHPKCAWVRYPGLDDDPAYPVARRYLQNGFGAMVVFGVAGGQAAGIALIDRLKLFSHLANVGDARSLALHPASTSHGQLSAEEQQATGVTPDLIRLSIGLEHSDDIIADLSQALA